MHSADSPFPCHWWGTSLSNSGLNEARPDVGTYGRYEFARLPGIPFDLRGDFTWLAVAPVQVSHIGGELAAENAEALQDLRKASAQLGLPLPEAFVKFMRTPALHQRIRSNSDCYLDLCPSPVRSPKGDDYLIRFLADSQGCIFWYLYLTRDGRDHAVASSSGFYGTEEEQWQDEEPDPTEIVFCAESFEAFLCPFWLKNEIWFAEWQKTPMPSWGLTYIEQYRRKQ